jgi:hypothetical protein
MMWRCTDWLIVCDVKKKSCDNGGGEAAYFLAFVSTSQCHCRGVRQYMTCGGSLPFLSLLRHH